MATGGPVVFVTVTVPTEKEAEFLAVMQIDVEGSRAEPGCLRFDLIKGVCGKLSRADACAIAMSARGLPPFCRCDD